MLRAKLVMFVVSAALCAVGRPSLANEDLGTLVIDNECAGALTIEWTNGQCSQPTIVRPFAITGLTLIRSFRTHIRGNDPVYCLYEIRDDTKKWLAAAKFSRSVQLINKTCTQQGGNCSCRDG